MIDPAFQQEYEFTRCKYPSKVCRNTRTRKRNGQLHRFCEVHRARANENQKRWSASRVKRWDTLAQHLGQRFYELHDDDHEEDRDGRTTVKAEPFVDVAMPVGMPQAFPMVSLDDYDMEMDDALPTVEPSATSWQDAATEELREFLGDLLLSIAADDVPMANSPPPVEPVATTWSTQPWR